MTLQQLEYIVALDTHRHFVLASKACFVTQPTITLQVKKLENEIGIQIFDRAKSPLTPTEMGEVIISKARRILAESNQLKALVNNERNDLKGTFRVGIIPTIAPYLVPTFVGGFAQKYESIALEMEEMQSEDIIDSLQKNKIDIGILITPLNESSLREIPLYNEPFMYYGESQNSRNTISTEEVENRKGLWLLSSGHCFRKQVLNICGTADCHLNIHFKSGSIETLIRMVNNYGGFTLIPELASAYTDQQNLLRFAEPQPVREVSIVVHKSFVKEALISALREAILQIIPDSFVKNTYFKQIKWR